MTKPDDTIPADELGFAYQEVQPLPSPYKDTESVNQEEDDYDGDDS